MDASTVSRAWSWLIAAPDDTITEADRRTVDAVGLELPVRASVAVAATTLLLLLDFSRVLVPAAIQDLGHSPAGLRAVALERVLLFGAIPLAIILLGFRDRPGRATASPSETAERALCSPWRAASS